jgi:hypothetical protein
MKDFKNFRSALNETASQINEKTVEKMKVGSGRKKYPAEIKKEGSKYVAYVDGDKLDEFRSEKDAKKGIEDFVELMDL